MNMGFFARAPSKARLCSLGESLSPGSRSSIHQKLAEARTWAR